MNENLHRELMVGNYLELDGEPEEITGWQIHNMGLVNEGSSAEYYKRLKPIDINEKWLNLFGFQQHIGGIWTKTIKRKKIGRDRVDVMEVSWDTISNTISLDTATFDVITGERSIIINEVDGVKYVHQLQNLFFSLTGRKLFTYESEEKKVGYRV